MKDDPEHLSPHFLPPNFWVTGVDQLTLPMQYWGLNSVHARQALYQLRYIPNPPVKFFVYVSACFPEEGTAFWKALEEFDLSGVEQESGPSKIVGGLRARIKAVWLKPLE